MAERAAQAGDGASLWQETSRTAGLGLDSLTGEVDADVCVVGLGGSGLTAALELARAGVRVVGLDAGEVARGAAGRNGGLLLAGARDFYHVARETLGAERALALYRATEAEQARIAEETPGVVRRTGSLRVAVDAREEADLEAQWDAMRKDALEVSRASTPWGPALRVAGDLSFHPLARARALARAAAAAGARLFENSRAVELEGERVATDGGTVRAGHVLVAVDGGLERVLPELEGHVRTARLQMLGTEPASDLEVPAPMYLRYGYEYVQQLASGELAVGGYRDRFEAEEWTHDARPTAGVQAEIEHFVRSTLGTKARVTRRWAASVGYSNGPLPYYGEPRPGVLAFGGYSGTGNLIGALCGRAAAARVRGERTALTELFEA
ncbi:MAG: FAD-binding oxidoreductase [Planctomycetota bacterium]